MCPEIRSVIVTFMQHATYDEQFFLFLLKISGSNVQVEYKDQSNDLSHGSIVLGSLLTNHWHRNLSSFQNLIYQIFTRVINRQSTANMLAFQLPNQQTMITKTPHRQILIEHYKPHLKAEMCKLRCFERVCRSCSVIITCDISSLGIQNKKLLLWFCEVQLHFRGLIDWLMLTGYQLSYIHDNILQNINFMKRKFKH